jgi:membrane protease YdiL (CAAX protease family)
MRRGQRSLRADFGLAFRWIDLPIGIGLALLAKFASVVYGLLAIVLTGEPPKTANFSISHDLAGVLTAILLVTLLGPLVEELLFRGLILRATRYAILRGRHRARPQPAPRGIQVRAAVVAVLVNSVLFAGLHLYQAPGDPALFISLALVTLTVGILNSIIVVVTGRLGAAIVAHVVGNGIAVAVQFALF